MIYDLSGVSELLVRAGLLIGARPLYPAPRFSAYLNNVWGDATSGTVTVNGTGIGVNVNHAVYGRIPALQNVNAGSYSDIIIVELTF